MSEQNGFYYIQTADLELYQKPVYFEESKLRTGERIIYSTLGKIGRPYFEYRKRHEEFIMLNDTKGLEFKETTACGFKDKLQIFKNGKYIGQFYFNMTGYNEDFSLLDKNGVGISLGEKGKTTVIREFKQAIREGHHWFQAYK